MTEIRDASDGGAAALRVRAASDVLRAHWRNGTHTESLPAELRPRSRAEAYAVQALIEGESALPLAGWKIAATSEAGQRHINVDGPLAGRLLAERILPLGGPPVALGSNRMRVAEVEFVFRMGRDLPPRAEPYSVPEVMDAVAALHLGVEIPDSRFLRFETVGAGQLIADNACADRFVLGPEAPASWRDVDLAGHRVTGRTSRGAVQEGRGGNVLGDPRIALAWLVNELSGIGVTLRAGEIVTTGVCVAPIPVAPGDVVTGDYGSFGTIEVAFA